MRHQKEKSLERLQAGNKPVREAAVVIRLNAKADPELAHRVIKATRALLSTRNEP